VIASFLQLDHGATVVATLPSFLLRYLDKGDGGGVFRTLLITWMVATITRDADFRRAALAFAEFATRMVRIGLDVRRFDPLATRAGGTVESVLGCVLLVFAIPFVLELVVEELIDVAKGDMFFCTASGGHVSWVGDRHGEDAAEAVMAHAMAAGEFGGFEVEDVVGTAGETRHSGYAVSMYVDEY